MRICEHLKDGLCTSCARPMTPKQPRFHAQMQPWALEFRGRLLKRYKTLNKLLTETAESNWLDFMIISPTGVRLSIEVGRMI